MPTSYTGSDEEDDPTKEQSRLKQPAQVQPLNLGTPLYPKIGAGMQPQMPRTFQQPQIPGGIPGQQSATPWTMGLGALNGSQGASATPWTQTTATQAAQAQQANSAYNTQQGAQSSQAQQAAQAAAAAQANSAYTNQRAGASQANQQTQQAASAAALNGAYNQQRMGGGGGMPNWAALAQRFGGAPMTGAAPGLPPGGFAGLIGAGAAQGGGNPWLQNIQNALAQRFAGLQQRAGGMPGGGVQGMPIIPQRRY
jgi:hypothetical protein